MLFNANQRTILFSSAGRRVDLIKRFRRASLELGIDTRLLAMDCDETAPAAKYVDRFFKVPLVDHPDFESRVEEILNEESVTDIFPLIHPEIPFWAERKQKQSGSKPRIWVGSSEFVALARDKAATKQWLQEHDFTIPALVEAGEPGSEVTQRLLIKPRYGCQSVGIRQLDTNDFWPSGNITAEEFVIESFIEGQEYTIDIFTDHQGEFMTAVPRKRIKIRGGEVIKAETVEDATLINTARSMVKQLRKSGHDVCGPFCVQGIMDEADVFHITEINARFGGGVPLSLQAGVMYPHMIISGKQRKPWKAWTPGVVMHRFDDARYDRS
jgi:carbamoyl-phosphate synthase large subunit